jgi:hypothetical protein
MAAQYALHVGAVSHYHSASGGGTRQKLPAWEDMK